MKRRNLIQAGAGLFLSHKMTPFSLAKGNQENNKRKVLILGGTDYFGPTLVGTLERQQCDITLFNRGITNPGMFSNLKHIKGDRELPNGEGLSNLKQHLKTHNYDWVVDTWQKMPLAVLEATKLLKNKIGHYQYVSSISVYRDIDQKYIDENYPLKSVEGLDPSLKSMKYSRRKILSEQFIFDTLGDKASSFRSHGMRSVRTPAPIYEPYWPVKLSRGGKVLLPLDNPHHLQVTDVFSMTEFMVNLGKLDKTGIYNVAYPTRFFNDYLDIAQQVTRKNFKPVWIPAEFLKQQNVLPYKNLPLWRPQPKGFYHFNVSKALENGLRNRPMNRMINDQLRGYFERHPRDDFKFGLHGTISSQKERDVIALWEKHKRS